MKRITQKSLVSLFCVLLIGLCACTINKEDCLTPDIPEDVQKTTYALEDAVYHVGTDAWIVPQNDPYTLANFRDAYDKLSLGQTKQALTRSQSSEFDGNEQLKATHYVLKIYPKNEDEQWEIELMEDLHVSYLPLDYVQLPEEEVENIPTATRSESATYPDQSHYTVTYDDLEDSEGAIDPETYVMPIMYAVWPCDKPLPEAYEYVIDYEVFIPAYSSDATRSSSSTTSLSEDALRILENEAIGLALGITPTTLSATRSDVVRTYKGKIEIYDRFLEERVPQANLRIRFQLGSSIWDTYTKYNGDFSITAAIPLNASYIHMFQHPRWKITFKETTAPYSVNWYTADRVWSDPNHNMCPGGSTTTYEVLPAVNFYFHGSHSIRTWKYESGIRVCAMGEPSGSTTRASFVYSSTNAAYIKVFNNAEYESNLFLGSILHEFGHFTMYGERGGQTGSAYNGYVAVHKLLRESYAEYAGWRMGLRYYAIKKYIPDNTFNLTGNDAQWWYQTSASVYSPLFVDLVDNYNQKTPYNSKNNDPISGVPDWVIREFAAECTTWDSVKNKLQTYVGVYYTQADLNTYLAPYNYWFANN